MKEPSLFSRKYRGRQVLMYSPVRRQGGRERGQGSQPSAAVPHNGHHSGRRMDKRVGRRVLLLEKPSRRPLLMQAGHWAGPSDPEVVPGRKAPAAGPQGTSCLSVCPAASHPCQRVAQSQGRPRLPNTHALWPCKAKSHGRVFTSTAVQVDQMSKHCARRGITVAVPSECSLTPSIFSNREYPGTLYTHTYRCTL